MDVFFHAAAGALLASSLGERRRRWLAAAAVLGALPDIAWRVPLEFGARAHLYPITHSLLLNGGLCVLLLAVNWRIAFASLLHVLVDLPLHAHSSLYRMLHTDGIAWYSGSGLYIWGGLWVLLIVLFLLQRRWLARTRPARARAD
jgi:hypothetical protein